MTTKTNNKLARTQIAFGVNDPINQRLKSLSNRYYGMSISEIVKLAIIELDNSNDNDETSYIKQDVDLYNRLLKYQNQEIEVGKIITNLEELQ
jgi:hypothetical protein